MYIYMYVCMYVSMYTHVLTSEELGKQSRTERLVYYFSKFLIHDLTKL